MTTATYPAGGLIEPIIKPANVNVRRLMVLMTVTVLALSLFFVAGAQAGSTLQETSTYVVGAGETLWDIAAEHTAPGGDVRSMLYDIRQANELSGSVIATGQTLILPANE